MRNILIKFLDLNPKDAVKSPVASPSTVPEGAIGWRELIYRVLRAAHPNKRRSRTVAEKMNAAPKRAPRRSLESGNDNQEYEFYVTALRSETYCSLLLVKNHGWE